MNNNIEQTIKNLHAFINDRLNQDRNLTKELCCFKILKLPYKIFTLI